ncbi:MAG: hypothetical protein D6806_02765 [Deltaproteobacteria bacterium]|nr:MAG: hypothetical protein D6806_02765 [Deltaproteobacteria bacterium]
MWHYFSLKRLLVLSGFVAVIAVGLSLVYEVNSPGPSNRELPASLHMNERHGKVLVWVFTKGAYAVCTQPAYVLRRIKQRYGDGVKIVVWYEAYDSTDVKRVLARERLSAELIPLDISVYEQWFGHSPDLVLHMIEDNQWVTSWSYGRQPIQAEEIMAWL